VKPPEGCCEGFFFLHCTCRLYKPNGWLFIVCSMFVANWFINVYYLWSSSSLKCCQTFWEVRIPLLVWGLASVISLGRLALPDSEVLVVPGRSTNQSEFQWLAIWSICDAAVTGMQDLLRLLLVVWQISQMRCVKPPLRPGHVWKDSGGGGGNCNTNFNQYVYDLIDVICKPLPWHSVFSCPFSRGRMLLFLKNRKNRGW